MTATTPRLRGALAPVLTPFDATLGADLDRFVSHCRWLVAQNASLAIFGTNSEAASLSLAERLALTEALLEAGIPPARLMPGTGASALTDAVELTRHASRAQVAGVLMLPPFFYKNVSDDGVFAYYAEVIERVGSGCAPIYLYHIPQMTQVPITLDLIERLLKRYPDVVAGAKDSSGDWNNSKAMIESFGAAGFDVFPASEIFLTRSLAIGGAGCISATVNMNPAAIRRLYDAWSTPEGPELQARADRVRRIFESAPMIPAMKHVVSTFAGVPGWRTVRPPLVALDPAVGARIVAELGAAGFAMPGYPR